MATASLHAGGWPIDARLGGIAACSPIPSGETNFGSIEVSAGTHADSAWCVGRRTGVKRLAMAAAARAQLATSLPLASCQRRVAFSNILVSVPWCRPSRRVRFPYYKYTFHTSSSHTVCHLAQNVAIFVLFYFILFLPQFLFVAQL
jgi:hypothetical protein